MICQPPGDRQMLTASNQLETATRASSRLKLGHPATGRARRQTQPASRRLPVEEQRTPIVATAMSDRSGPSCHARLPQSRIHLVLPQYYMPCVPPAVTHPSATGTRYCRSNAYLGYVNATALHGSIPSGGTHHLLRQ